MVDGRRMRQQPERREHSPEDGPVESPPEGSSCAEHPERPALAVCPVCGGYACLACWHHAVRRCHACLMRDPGAAAPPIPWEDRRRTALLGWLATLATALRPAATAPAFAGQEITRARTFWITTFLPLAALTLVVPFTHTITFGPSFGIALRGNPSDAQIVLDVARAAGLGLSSCLVALLALAMPYVSIVRAYAEKGHPAAPLRAVLYRSFLAPLAPTMFWLLVWGWPQAPSVELQSLTELAAALPLVLLLVSLRSAARMAAGVGPFASYLTAIVPLAAMLLAYQFVLMAFAPFLPASDGAVAAGGP